MNSFYKRLITTTICLLLLFSMSCLIPPAWCNVTTMEIAGAAVSRATVLNLGVSPVTYQKTGGGTGTFNPTTANSPADNAEGWNWAFSTKTLTLDGVNITDYIVIPANATITLQDNSVNTVAVNNSTAIWCGGNGTINGLGSLNIAGSAKTGIYAGVGYTLRITDCKITVTSNYSGALGISADYIILEGETNFKTILTAGQSRGIDSTNQSLIGSLTLN